MVVSHHVVAGIWTPDLWKSSRVLLPTEPSHQPVQCVLIILNSYPISLDVLPFPTNPSSWLPVSTEVLLCCLHILRCSAIHMSIVSLQGATHLKKADSLSPRGYQLSVAPRLDTSTFHAGIGLVCCPNHCEFICVVSRRHSFDYILLLALALSNPSGQEGL